MVSANERWCYNVTSSLIGWAHTQHDPWCFLLQPPGSLKPVIKLRNSLLLRLKQTSIRGYFCNMVNLLSPRWPGSRRIISDNTVEYFLRSKYLNLQQGKSEGFESCDRPKVWKRPIWVKIGDVLSHVTLKFDGWTWKTIGHLSFAVSSFVQHFIAIGEFKLELQSGNAQFGSNSTIFFSSVTLKFDRWHWKTIGHLFYATSSFVHHFVDIGELKLELQSGNA